MLVDILKQKQCFKLVCGAGNEDVNEVEKLVFLYSKAGCNFFDLSANIEIIEAAKKGLKRANISEDRYLCVSVGIKGDPHIDKAKINSKKCNKCGLCFELCNQKAIIQSQKNIFINSKRCIGCGVCKKNCPLNAVEMEAKTVDLSKILPKLIKKGIDCIEFHAINENDDEVFEKFDEINSCYDGILSLCVDRSKLGNEKLLQRTKKMIENREPFSTIIQADGAPMSGAKDDFKTTLQAIAMAEIFQDENLPVYILLSGGTNSKSTILANQCGIFPHGVAIGTYARKIVSKYIEKEDFFENKKNFEEALKIAKNLVDTSLKNLKAVIS